ncbi:MAG: LacI family DNA-binding transcriptional regulator [Streptococcaceae bacterium]|nr:LacI family DNA-binding transcriptional regulator [Streptococcaceae bacterium]
MNINDVAREAGVSRGSVSNYLNNRRVSDKISLKIEAAIQKMNYVPNMAARDLRARDSKFVIFIIPTVWTPFFSELTYHVQSELTKKGFKMILCISNSDFEKEKEYLSLAESQKAAGIISVSYSDMNNHVKANMPLVSIEKEPTGRFPLVSSDNYAGGKLAAQTLHERGSKSFVFVYSLSMTSDAMLARRSGFIDYCMQHDLPVESLALKNKNNKIELHSELLAEFGRLKINRNISNLGIFGISDEYAGQVLSVLAELEIEVPRQVQIIGFDGSRETVYTEPFISSIRQPIESLAETAVSLLIKRISENSQTENISVDRLYLPVTFQEGKTTQSRQDFLRDL